MEKRKAMKKYILFDIKCLIREPPPSLFFCYGYEKIRDAPLEYIDRNIWNRIYFFIAFLYLKNII